MKLLTYLILTTSYSSEIDTVIILSLYLVKPRYREVRQLVQYSVSGRDTPLSQAAWLHPCATQLIDNENTKDRRKLGLIFTYSSFLHSKWIWNYYKNDSKSESNKRYPLWTPKCTTRHTKKKCLILVLRELTSHLEVSKHTHEKTTCINQNQAFYHFSQTSPFPHIPLPNDINTFQSPRLEIASCLFLHMKLFLHLSLHSHSSHSLYFGLSCQCKCYCFLVF